MPVKINVRSAEYHAATGLPRRFGNVAGRKTPKELPKIPRCRACVILATRQDMGSVARGAA
jgi:hypothetical protein